ncbi:MAG TPA: hypothetical protein VKX40_13395 [Aequorivita sp.]|nr:hypothetical protein [Aequorivita sp.]
MDIGDEDEFRDAFIAEIEKVTKNKKEFIKIEVLESFKSFKIMEGFVSQIADRQFSNGIGKHSGTKKNISEL